MAVYISEEEYLNHLCEKTKAKPVEIEHLVKSTTPHFAKIAEAAKARGDAKKK